MRAKEFLTEVFDKGRPFFLDEINRGEFVGGFAVGGAGQFGLEGATKYVFTAKRTEVETDEAVEYISKQIGEELNQYDDEDAALLRRLTYEKFPSFDVEFYVEGQEDAFAVTGTGNELEVFGTVLNMVTELVKRTGAIELIFTAKEASRRKLYSRMTKKFAGKLGFGFTEFTTTKNQWYILYRK